MCVAPPPPPCYLVVRDDSNSVLGDLGDQDKRLYFCGYDGGFLSELDGEYYDMCIKFEGEFPLSLGMCSFSASCMAGGKHVRSDDDGFECNNLNSKLFIYKNLRINFPNGVRHSQHTSLSNKFTKHSSEISNIKNIFNLFQI